MRSCLSKVILAVLLFGTTFATTAQELYFEASGNGNSFLTTGGEKSYSLRLNGNSVADGAVKIATQGVQISGIPAGDLVPDLNANAGFTISILASHINQNGQIIQFNSSGNAGLRFVDGYVQGVWGEGLYQSPSTIHPITSDKSYSMVINYSATGGLELYLDGVKCYANVGLKSSATSISQMTIGSMASFVAVNNGMQIKRIRIYDNKLSQTQIEAESQYSPPNNSALELLVTNAQQLLLTTKLGDDPGLYSLAARQTLQEAIAEAITKAESNPSESEAELAYSSLNQAMTVYSNSENSIVISTASTAHWYYIMGMRGSTPTALFSEVRGVGMSIQNFEKSSNDAQLWKAVAHSSGVGYTIVNKQDGTYINTDIEGSQTTLSVDQEPSRSLQFKKNGANVSGVSTFLVENSGQPLTFRLHSGGPNNSYCLMNYLSDVNDNCTFTFIGYQASSVMAEVIEAAEQLYTQSPEGTNPGQFNREHRLIFRQAIDEAIAFDSSLASAEDKAAYAKNVVGVAQDVFLSSRNIIRVSALGEEIWYYISGVINYASGQVIVAQTSETDGQYKFTTKSLDPNKLFKFVHLSEGKLGIVNRATNRAIGGDAGVKEYAEPFEVTFLGQDAQFSFKGEGYAPLHAQNLNSLLVT